ncbi:MAG: phosphodiester glycosidase family protein [Deltaproteobacteria bacterium]|nr:phosphodiester glycosidase family protein [Deltaproteobacteria bacterium]
MGAAKQLIAVIILLALLFVRTAHVEAQAPGKLKIGNNLTVSELGVWRTIHKGVEFRTIVVERGEPKYQMELKLVRFDSKLITVKILASSDFSLKSASAKTFVEKSGVLAAINANYFDEKGRPLAYLKTLNHEINRSVSKHGLYTGVFAVRDGAPVIIHRDEFQPAQAGEALQSGPLLLNRGTPVETMRGLGRYARRAFVGIDKDGRTIVGVTDAVLGGLSFAELQELFVIPKAQLEISDLLNLDGGGSAQLHIKAGKFEESVLGTTEVPVAIGFFSKSN